MLYHFQIMAQRKNGGGSHEGVEKLCLRKYPLKIDSTALSVTFFFKKSGS
jgi:hypothetical protein